MNNFTFKETQCLIELKNNQGYVIGEAVIDIEDFDRIKEWHWSLHKKGYVWGYRSKDEWILLHRLVLGESAGTHTDHKDENKLDCRKCNLRSCTNSQNLMNRGKQRNNTSGYKGVSWDKKVGKWFAYIWKDRKRINLGYYDDKRKAAIIYNEAALIYHGNFAKLNEV